jgi:DNA primase small subunit
LDAATSNFLQRAFRNYYFESGSEVEVPSHPEQREFGYLTFEGSMVRHISCQDSGVVKAMLLRESPRGAFCSVSLYEDPSLPMEDKGWKEANLVFDIDPGDLNLPCSREHDFYICQNCQSPGRSSTKCVSCGSSDLQSVHWVCRACIEGARREVSKLQDVLGQDFGVPTSKIRLYFSGNRGYHLHTEGTGYEKLDQNGRAELVEYLSGKGLLPRHFGFSSRWSNFDPSRLPGDGEPGWRGRVARYLASKYSTSGKQAMMLLHQSDRQELKRVIESALREIAVRVDAAVTSDIHRIFRIPGTLHEKSGLQKKKMESIDEDPLISAVALDALPVRVYVSYAPEFYLKGEKFGPYKKESVKLPTYAAAYLAAKGVARVSG